MKTQGSSLWVLTIILAVWEEVDLTNFDTQYPYYTQKKVGSGRVDITNSILEATMRLVETASHPHQKLWKFSVWTIKDLKTLINLAALPYGVS